MKSKHVAQYLKNNTIIEVNGPFKGEHMNFFSCYRNEQTVTLIVERKKNKGMVATTRSLVRSSYTLETEIMTIKEAVNIFIDLIT